MILFAGIQQQAGYQPRQQRAAYQQESAIEANRSGGGNGQKPAIKNSMEKIDTFLEKEE